MALRDEHADILGGPILQRPESGLFAAFSRYHFVFKSTILLGLGLVVWIVGARGLEHLRKLRDLRYRKAMRRKHGIPDSDCRPFAVAYAAAKRAHLEREAQGRKRMTNYASDHNLPAVDQRTDAQKDARGLTRRVPGIAVQPHDHRLHSKHTAACNDKRSETHPLDFVDRYNPNPRYQMTVPEPLPVERHSIRRASRKDLIINVDNNEESRKRSFEDESDVEYETMKKSRIDQDGLKNPGDRAQYGETSRRASREPLSRRSEGNFVYADGQEGCERVNGLEDEVYELVDEAMEGVEEIRAAEIGAVARGKKRDRAEAGSSFGGDDDDDDTRNGRISHHRKRRSVLQRRVEAPARGQKRDREAESAESQGEEADSETSRRRVQRKSKKKRGKKAALDETGKMFVEDVRTSADPLCDGRRIGDEWEADGVQYKVGDKGERLRLALVKKARNKYHMPQDSQHPDRSAALEIYVETWMTDDQYKCAEERQELAWQEAPGEPSGSKIPDIADSPMKSGKNLLWDSVKGSPARRPLRQFVPAGASTRINPFEHLQPALGRRVASSSAIASPILSGVADSPTRPGFRGFSKWEKQDREADVLARIRAKIEDQKKTQTPQKSADLLASASAPELGAKPLSIPTITLTPAPVVAADGRANSLGIPRGEANTPVSFTPPGTNDSIKGTVAASTTGFSLPSTSIPAATPATLLPSAPTAPASTLSSPFPLGKSLQVPLPTTVTSSPVAPKLFEKGSGAGAAFTPNSLLSAPGATSQPSTESVFKPQSSSFVKPVTFSFTSPTAGTSSSATKSQAPDVSATSPPPTISTSAVAKAAALVSPSVLTSTTASENSKPTIPPFSFSSPSSSATTLQPSTAPPKFSFGQPPVTSTFTTSPGVASGAVSQAKPVFKFGQTLSSAKDGDLPSMAPVANETKKSAVPLSVFGTATGSNEAFKPPLFETPSTSGSSSLPSASASIFSAKPVAVDNSTSSSAPPMPTSALSSITTTNNMPFSAPAEAPASANIPLFTFGGTNSGSKAGEGSKSASLFGGVTSGSNPMSVFGTSTTEKKPTFTFGAPTEGSKPISIFGGNAEGSKPPVFGGSAGSSARSRGGM